MRAYKRGTQSWPLDSEVDNLNHVKQESPLEVRNLNTIYPPENLSMK